MQFLHGKWFVFALWCFSGAITAAVKAGLVPAELAVYATGAAGALVTLPVKLGAKS